MHTPPSARTPAQPLHPSQAHHPAQAHRPGHPLHAAQPAQPIQAAHPAHAGVPAQATPPATAHRAPLAANPAPLELNAASLCALLDEIDTGIVLCDALGRLILANEAARAELQGADALGLDEHGLLQPAAPASTAALRRALVNAAVGRRRQLLTLPGAPGAGASATLRVSVQPLAQAGGTQAPVVLVFGRRQLAPQLAVEMLATQHALTPAERRVLTGLLAGRRVADLADAHGVAVSTVRTQVAALRAKFGVRRIDDLLRLVAEMPPMMSALRGLPRRLDN